MFAVAMAHGDGTWRPLLAQTRLLDLSESPIATIVSSEYDRGFLERIGNIVVTELGIWLADYGQTRVLRFDDQGNLMAEYGRGGGGPGEFASVGRFRVDSILTVNDPRQGREVRFGPDGTHLETRQSLRFRDGTGRERPVRGSAQLRNGVHVLHSEPGFTWPSVQNSEPFQRVVLAYPGVERLDTLLSYHWGVAGWGTERRAGLLRTPFGNGGAWELLGDTAIVLADGVAGTLTFVRPMGDSFEADTIDLELAARPISSRDLDRARAEDDLPRGAELFDVPEYWSVATRLILGQDGRYWLRQAVEGDQEHWIVVVLGTGEKWRVVLPERFRLNDVQGGLLYGVATDALDVPSVGALMNPITAGLVPDPA